MAYTTVDDPSIYFHTQLYTGNGGTQAIANNGNSDLQPDWVWIKERPNADDHKSYDSSRGATKKISQNDGSAEEDQSGVTAFSSDGFSLGSHAGSNQSSTTYVAWQWKANAGTTANNDDGNLTTVVQANQAAGFSIVLWTSTGSSDTIGHGLGATPTVIIEKSRSATGDWTFFTSVGGRKLLFLNNTNTVTTSFSGVSNVGSSIFTDGNGGTDTRVAYCFAPIQGYSKFGTYEGNANANGVFVYTGFKPAWLMVKNIDSANVWQIYDNKREPNNPNIKRINAHESAAESTSGSDRLDFLSNGFKMRATSGNINSAHTYIYMAFADSPFVSSKGVPTTAN